VRSLGEGRRSGLSFIFSTAPTHLTVRFLTETNGGSSEPRDRTALPPKRPPAPLSREGGADTAPFRQWKFLFVDQRDQMT
jgi:hypothetical protein